MRVFCSFLSFSPNGTVLDASYGSYKWDGTTAPISSGAAGVGVINVPLDINDNEHDIRAKAIEAVAIAWSVDQKDVVLV